MIGLAAYGRILTVFPGRPLRTDNSGVPGMLKAVIAAVSMTLFAVLPHNAEAASVLDGTLLRKGETIFSLTVDLDVMFGGKVISANDLGSEPDFIFNNWATGPSFDYKTQLGEIEGSVSDSGMNGSVYEFVISVSKKTGSFADLPALLLLELGPEAGINGLAARQASQTNRAVVSGLNVIPLPAPALLLLSGLGALTLLRRQRRG
jgi:hypothetical protein